MAYDYKQLTNTMREVLRLKVAGMTHVQIAQVLDITPQTVHNMVTSQQGSKALNLLHDRRDGNAVEMGERITACAERAMGIVEEVLAEAPERKVDSKTLLDTAFKALGLAGYTPTKRVMVESTRQVEAGLLERLKAVSVDADVVEVEQLEVAQ